MSLVRVRRAGRSQLGVRPPHVYLSLVLGWVFASWGSLLHNSLPLATGKRSPQQPERRLSHSPPEPDSQQAIIVPAYFKEQKIEFFLASGMLFLLRKTEKSIFISTKPGSIFPFWLHTAGLPSASALYQGGVTPSTGSCWAFPAHTALVHLVPQPLPCHPFLWYWL